MVRQAVNLSSRKSTLDLKGLSLPSSRSTEPIKINAVVDCLQGLVSPAQALSASIASDIDITIGPERRKVDQERAGLFTPLRDIRITAARQSLLCGILRPNSAGEAQTTRSDLLQLESACRVIIDGHWGPPRPDRWNCGDKPETWREYFESHFLGTYRFYLVPRDNGTHCAARVCVEGLQKALKHIGGSLEPHIRHLVDQIPKLYRAIEKFRMQLIKAGITSPPSYGSLYPRSPESPFRTFRQYQESVRCKMQLQDPIILGFREEVRALLRFVKAAQFISENDLRPVSLVGSGSTSFEEARNPWLSPGSAVPFSFKFLEDKPITLFTGDNGAGKSKALEALFYNWLYAQSIGFAYCKSGKIGAFRERFVLLGAETSNLGHGEEDSRGEREMARHVNFVGNDIHQRALLVLDEFLTSTDPVGALAIALASLEANAQAGGFSLVSLHNPSAEKLVQTTCARSLQLLRPHPRKKYQWEEGVASANVIKLARRFGLPESQVTRAAEILSELREAE